jgi:hypothetical protein
MKLYWTYNSIPELADLPKDKRKEVWATCHRKMLHRYIWVACVIGAVCVPAGMIIGESYFGRIGGIIEAMIAGGIGGLIIGEVKVAMTRPHIREYLISHEKTN